MSGVWTLVWDAPPSEMALRLAELGRRILQAVRSAMAELADGAARYAQAIAPWQDRTGAARAGLGAESGGGEDGAWLSLFHSVYYGIYLELRWGGKYAAIMPTLRYFYPIVMEKMRSIMGG